MMARPTTSMKKGWLCRTSYDEKNHEIAPVMIQIEWWLRSSDDSHRWSRSSDDDPAVMIQIEWWSRSSPVMLIQIERWSKSSDDAPWWSRSRDDPDPMKMTYRWRWLEDEDDFEDDNDLDDTEKKTCADKLCQENTFLVKRECWCNCNFGMYSLVFLIYCNPMFIPGCIWVMSCPDVPIGKLL